MADDTPLPPVSGVASVHPTIQVAQNIPGYDPTPHINAQEQQLADYLNVPVHEVLGRLGIQLPPPGMPLTPMAPGHAAADSGSPFDASSMIKPVTDALGTLGTGVLEGLDPSKVFDGISKTFESTAQSVQQAIGSLSGIWDGAGGAAAAAKSTAAMGNGVEVATQSAGLGGSVTTATADVKQGEVRLLEILHEWEAKMAALTPGLPWTAPGIAEACAQATEMSVQCMTELQTALAAQAGEVSAIGAPVAVTSAPQLGAQMVGPAVQMVTGMISPLTSMASQAMSAGMGGITKAMSAGLKAGTDMASKFGQATKGADVKPAISAVSNTATGRIAGSGLAGVGGGSSSSTPMSPRVAAPAPLGGAEAAKAVSTGAPVARAVSAAGLGGGGAMGGAPAAAAGSKAGANGDAHVAASFLQTDVQGTEVVGHQGVATPPVIGEADPNDDPDVDLRI